MRRWGSELKYVVLQGLHVKWYGTKVGLHNKYTVVGLAFHSSVCAFTVTSDSHSKEDSAKYSRQVCEGRRTSYIYREDKNTHSEKGDQASMNTSVGSRCSPEPFHGLPISLWILPHMPYVATSFKLFRHDVQASLFGLRNVGLDCRM